MSHDTRQRDAAWECARSPTSQIVPTPSAIMTHLLHRRLQLGAPVQSRDQVRHRDVEHAGDREPRSGAIHCCMVCSAK